MLITKEVEVTLGVRNIRYYENLGYKIPKYEDRNHNMCVKRGTKINVKIEDLSEGSNDNIIGDVDTGIYKTAEAKQIKSEFDKITRQSQSTDECINCPIAQGCAWCSAYNYQKFGTANHRATFICPMHKAASLANVYYWNKRYKKENINKQFNLNCNIIDAIEIVGKSEVDYLLNLSQRGG